MAKCLRCGNDWTPRMEGPKRCPACNSPYWNKPRIERIHFNYALHHPDKERLACFIESRYGGCIRQAAAAMCMPYSTLYGIVKKSWSIVPEGVIKYMDNPDVAF